MKTKKDHRIGNKYRQTHGLTGSPEFAVWRTMKARCSNPNRPEFHRYGGRGIKVCKAWIDSFESFYKDMGPRPSKSHQIDRRDNDKGYSPCNCRWVTPEENASNSSQNRNITWNGETKTVTQWGRDLGLNRGAIAKRLEKGWTIKQALSIPKLHQRYRTMTPSDIIKAMNTEKR